MTISNVRTLRATILLVVASFLAVHLIVWLFPSVFNSWNSQMVDQLFQLRSSFEQLQPPYDERVIHVDLSDVSLQRLGTYYVSRDHFARVIRNLGAMGTAVQIWDFIIAARADEEQDRRLVDALREAGNVYFGIKLDLHEGVEESRSTFQNPEYMEDLRTTSWNVVFEGDSTLFYRGENPLATFREFAVAVKGLGYLSIKFDADGVFRRQPLLVRFEEKFFPSFPFRAICEYLKVTPDRIIVRPGESVTLKEAQKPGQEPHDIVIPIDVRGNIIINFAGPWERMRHYDFADVYLASDDRDEMEIMAEDHFEERLVVVSQVTTGSADAGPVPTDNDFPLSGLHANIMHTILTENFLRDIKGYETILLELVLLCVIVLFSMRLSSLSLALSAVVLLVVYASVAAMAFFFGHLIMEILRPSLTIITALFSIIAYRFVNEEKEKEVLRRSFEAYFPPAVVKRIMANPDMITAAGQKKELTVLFSDIKSFTTYSSTMTPDEIQKLLNEYFEAMVEIVFKYEGTVDKFIGDGLMVFFGDPEPQQDHALRCVKAAIEMQKKCRELKARWEKEGKMPIKIRVGINTGPVVVGNMGSSRRLSYTVLGSDVNLAQRLEANAPVEGIMISQRTFELVNGSVPTRPLEPVKVKGLEEPIQVYEVLVDGAPS